MTSVLRRYSQIDVRQQFMTVLDISAVAYTYNITSNTPSAPVMTKTNFGLAYQFTLVFLQGQMLKDLGRFIHVYDPSNSNNLYQVYRQVMLVDGLRGTAIYEGVTPKIGYICTWSADDTHVLLARIG